MGNEMKDPIAAYFDKHAETHKRQFVGSGSGASFYFQTRLKLACELAGASTGRLLDCAAGSGEITCALLESGRFPHATIVDISPAMLQSARELLSSQLANVELEFVHSDIFNFKPSDSGFDLILCLGLIAHLGRLDVLLPHLKSMLMPSGRIILQTTLTDHAGTRIVRALTTQTRAGQARVPHFLVFAARHYRGVPSLRVGDLGHAKAQLECPVWRSFLAVGKLSTGNPPAKVGQPTWSGRDLPPRAKLKCRM